MPDYQIDPHLRHDFPPPGRRLARWTRRLRLWFRRQQYRQAQWLLRLPDPYTAALHLLVVGLLLIVLFQAGLLVLLRPR